MMFHAPPIQVPQPAWAPPSVPVVVAAAPLESSAQMQTIRRSLERPFTIVLPNLQAGALAAAPPVFSGGVPLDPSTLLAINSQRRIAVIVPPLPWAPLKVASSTVSGLPRGGSPSHQIIRNSLQRRPVDVPQPVPAPQIAQSPRTAFSTMTPDQLNAINSQKRAPVVVPQPPTVYPKVNGPAFPAPGEGDFLARGSLMRRPVVVPGLASSPPAGKAAVFTGGIYLGTPGNYAQLGGILSFTRADPTTCASYNDINSIVQTAPANSLRDGHYVGGVRTILLESSRQSVLLQSDNVSLSPWALTHAGSGVNPVVSASAGVAPDGSNNAAKVVFNAPGAGDISQLSQNCTVTVSTWTAEVYVMAFAVGDVGKTILIRGVGAAAYTSVVLTASWQRVATTEPSVGTARDLDILLRPSSGGSSGTVSAFVWRGGMEPGAYATSSLATGASAVTRALDALALVGAPVTGTLYYHYWDLATLSWLSAVAAYTANSAIVPTVDHAYDKIAVLGSQGVLTAAQVIAILAGGPTGSGGNVNRRRRRI